MSAELNRNLLDADGENRAVRMFLALYGGAYTITTHQMREHLQECGYPCWPQWAEEDQDLTKCGAQEWLRHLFALEAQPVSAGLTDEQVIFDWLQRKYVQRADSRQKMLGLVYTEAETHDLAEGLAKLFSSLLSAAQRDSQPVADRIAELEAALAKAQEALKFYADGDHFVRHDPGAWDTVSGEPENFYEDEANTATVEDGSVAKFALEQLSAAPRETAQPAEGVHE